METMDSSERGMNPVAMIVINPWRIPIMPMTNPVTSCSLILYTTDGGIKVLLWASRNLLTSRAKLRFNGKTLGLIALYE